MYKKAPHIDGEIFQKKQKRRNGHNTHGDVWQDNNAVSRVRAQADQPVTVGDGQRTRPTNNKKHRSQNSHSNNRLEQLAFWTEKPIRDQILYIAQTENISISKALDGLVKYSLRQRFYEQQQATLPSIINQAVARSNRTLAKRLAAILIRIVFDTGQIRVLSTNILGHQPGMTEKSIKEILQMGDTRTKANLTRRTPQLKELEDAIERYLLEEEQEEGKAGKEGRG